MVKVVILAGGLGTRLSEETTTRPKPMVEIGGLPILLHIMKYYYSFGIDEFIVCCGYKGYQIKEYFKNYQLHNSDVEINGRDLQVRYLNDKTENWKITLIDTGLNTQTGGRLARVEQYLREDDYFCLTYGDGLCDVDINDVISMHTNSRKLSTVVGVQPPGRYGAIVSAGTQVKEFTEKPKGDSSLINGGFFVLSPQVLDYITGDDTIWEHGPMSQLASEGQMNVYHHTGFWQSMDTLREKNILQELWDKDQSPWKRW